ncbi:MAG TPA: hypothetical protein VHG29_10260 [Novosphingobium sp.]|nr:hypothetical protein [Novosphingobium sp.]
MSNSLWMGEAARKLATKAGISGKLARRVIVSQLMDEQLVASCDAYYRDSIPAISALSRQRFGHAAGEGLVPLDFWSMKHASHFEWNPGGGSYPSGSWGCWGDEHHSRFTTEIILTGSTAALRFADFGELAEQGSGPVTLVWSALGVTLAGIDVQRLIDERGFNNIIEKNSRRPHIQWGNLSKSDSLRLVARLCVVFLTVAEQEDLVANPDKILRALRLMSTSVSDEASLTDKMLAQVVALITEEAGSLSFARSQIAPTM